MQTRILIFSVISGAFVSSCLSMEGDLPTVLYKLRRKRESIFGYLQNPQQRYDLKHEMDKGFFEVEEGFEENKHEAFVDSVVASHREKMRILAAIVCNDLGIENGSYEYLLRGINAPKGSLHASAFRNWTTLISACDKVAQLDPQDCKEIYLMIAGVKPIAVEHLRKKLGFKD